MVVSDLLLSINDDPKQRIVNRDRGRVHLNLVEQHIRDDWAVFACYNLVMKRTDAGKMEIDAHMRRVRLLQLILDKLRQSLYDPVPPRSIDWHDLCNCIHIDAQSSEALQKMDKTKLVGSLFNSYCRNLGSSFDNICSCHPRLMLRARYYAATSLLAAEPAGETALCLLGIGLDSGLCVGSGITDLLVEGVNSAVKLLVGLLSVLVDVLFCVGAVRLELGVELAGLFAGVLDLERVLAMENGVTFASVLSSLARPGSSSFVDLERRAASSERVITTKGGGTEASEEGQTRSSGHCEGVCRGLKEPALETGSSQPQLRHGSGDAMASVTFDRVHWRTSPPDTLLDTSTNVMSLPLAHFHPEHGPAARPPCQTLFLLSLRVGRQLSKSLLSIAQILIDLRSKTLAKSRTTKTLLQNLARYLEDGPSSR
ncbi:hypothetical protein KCU91_g60, partial [Aureobasidium melanogenum]